MNLSKFLYKDHIRLFLLREGRFMLGGRLSNLWIMTAMLTAMLLALSFSNASIDFLRYKMDDPFIKWLDIKNQGYGTVVNELKDILEEPENTSRFHYTSVREDYQFSFFFYENESELKHYISCRMFNSYDAPIFRAVLSRDNLVGNASVNLDELSQASVGVIVTENVLRLLKYNQIPPYIFLSADCSVTGETAGLEVIGDYAKVPLPVLAVVKRLPGNVDMVSSASLYSGINAFTFDLGAPQNEDYASSLYYYIPKGINLGSLEVGSMVWESPKLKSFSDGRLLSLNTDGMELDDIIRTADIIKEDYHHLGVNRLFDYHLPDAPDLPEFPAYLSVQFQDLKQIPQFSEFVSSQTESMDPERRISVDITMTNAKENFNAVSTMATILSWALVLFSIISILLFIMNLLHSYFQKVKRNIGTFKAFGMGNRELTAIYVVIIMAAATVASAMAVATVWILERSLNACRIVHEDGFPFLSLWSLKTAIALVLVMAAVFTTVFFVMRRLLRATPGDLIYDRQ